MFPPQIHIALGDPETRESSSEQQVQVVAEVQLAFVLIQVDFVMETIVSLTTDHFRTMHSTSLPVDHSTFLKLIRHQIAKGQTYLAMHCG